MRLGIRSYTYTVNSFGALEGPAVVVDALAAHTCNLHIKDFTITRVPSQMGFVVAGCPAGQGRLEVPGFFRRFRERQPEMSAIGTEPPWPSMPSVATGRARVSR